MKNFTPDGKKCYKCDNEDVGMIGCEGACNYSIKRNDILKCENKCKKGYIEIREGICEPCEIYNKGCYECHYENKYQKNYAGLKRKRRFVCDYCEEGLIQKEDKCLTCDDLNLNDCEKCEIDQINNDKYICTKCNEYSILLENNTCRRCDDNNKFQNNNKCYYCNDTDYNGIKGCSKCEKNKNKIICQLCDSGYILLENNNSCLNISENKELIKYNSCEKLAIDNNNDLYCKRCKNEYSLLKDNINDKGNCTMISILYDFELVHIKNYLDGSSLNYFKRNDNEYYFLKIIKIIHVKKRLILVKMKCQYILV